MGGEVQLNFYRERQLPGGRVLLTTESGDWVIISREKHRLLEEGRTESDFFLHNILKDKFIILDDENRDGYERRLRGRYSHLFRPPSLHIVAVTKRCPVACDYCHANASQGSSRSLDMPRKTGSRVVDFIFQSSARQLVIEFQGGEPLLNFEAVRHIILYAEKKNLKEKRGLRFALVTNLLPMDDEKLRFLMEHRVGLCTSLDGPADVHDAHRRLPDGSGTHSRVVSWIERIKKQYPLDALMVTTDASLSRAKEIVDEYVRLGFRRMQLRPAMNLGYALGSSYFSADEYLRFWREAMDYIISLNRDMLFVERYSAYILTKLMTHSPTSFVDLNSPCGAVISTLAYDHMGLVYSCDEARQYEMFRLGSVEQPLKKIFMSGEAQGIIRSSVNDCLLCDACVWKPFCGVCPVCTYAESGTLVPKLSKSIRCRVLDGMFTYLMDAIQSDRHNEVFARWIKS